MLFLSGTRDELAERALLEPLVASLPTATLHWLDDGRSRLSRAEAAAAAHRQRVRRDGRGGARFRRRARSRLSRCRSAGGASPLASGSRFARRSMLRIRVGWGFGHGQTVDGRGARRRSRTAGERLQPRAERRGSRASSQRWRRKSTRSSSARRASRTSTRSSACSTRTATTSIARCGTTSRTLFADDGTIEIGLDGVYVGKARVREYLYALGGGRQGLVDGELNEHLQVMPVITVAADGLTAKARWRAITLTGELGGDAFWGEGPYENEYVKDGGVWKIKTLHWYQALLRAVRGRLADESRSDGRASSCRARCRPIGRRPSSTRRGPTRTCRRSAFRIPSASTWRAE